MATLWTVVLTLGALTWTCQGQTIRQVIEQRADLREFWDKFLSGTEIGAHVGQQDLRYTLFAPNNDAMRRLPADVMRDLTGSSTESKELREKLIGYHIVPPNPETGRPYDVKDFKDRRVQTIAKDALKVFLRTFNVGPEKRYYVNGARVTEPDMDATNGRVHIIDTVLYPIAVKRNALSLIELLAQNTKRSESTQLFKELLGKVRFKSGSPYSYLNSDSNFVTMFVPSDESLTKVLTRPRKEDLLNNEDQIIDLLNRHVIVETMNGDNAGVTGVWHAALLNDFIDNAIEQGRAGYEKITALKDDIKPVRIANTLYVTNVCGMVKVLDLPMKMYGEDGMNGPNPGNENFGTGLSSEEDEYEYDYQERRRQEPAGYGNKYKVMANLTVNNGVVHIVDGLMGYIYNDAIEMIEEDNEISKFRDQVLMSSRFKDMFTVRGATVPNKKYTIFAPIDSAFANIEQAGNIDLSQDDELRERVLNMHILDGEMALSELGNNIRKSTLETTEDASFSTDRYGTYIEVGRIRATIVRADVCVKNGIIHYIDRLLGVPYRNLLDEIKSRDELLALNDNIDQTPKFIPGKRDGLRPLPEILRSADPVRTLFAPNLFAFNKMRATKIGRQYLAEPGNSEKLYFLILRHAPRGEFYIPDEMTEEMLVPDSDQLYVFKEGEDYFVEYRSEYGKVTARIVERNLRMTNGVVHIIDLVLYIDNQGAFAVVGASNVCLPSLLVLASSILLRLLL